MKLKKYRKDVDAADEEDDVVDDGKRRPIGESAKEVDEETENGDDEKREAKERKDDVTVKSQSKVEATIDETKYENEERER